MKEKIVKIILIIIVVLIAIFFALEIFGLRLNRGFFTYKNLKISDECQELPPEVTSRWLKEKASQCSNCVAVTNGFDISNTGEQNISHYICYQNKRSPLFRHIK